MSWIAHIAIRTPCAIQYSPALPIGSDWEVWAHIKGQHPTQWHQWMPACRLPPGTGMDDLDILMSRKVTAAVTGFNGNGAPGAPTC
jgi:hypothetical protein